MDKIFIFKKSFFEHLKGYLFMLLGCVAYGLSTSFFLAPSDIVAGGVSGLSVMIGILTRGLFNLPNGLPVGMLIIVINLPIIVFAIRIQGWKFVLKCLLTVAVLGFATDLIAMISIKIDDNPLLRSLYGGVFQGIGIGFFVKYEFSSGGTELLGRLICHKVKLIKINVCVGILDMIIVVFGAIVTKDPNNMLYALIVIFCSTKVSEIILFGLDKSKLCIIITDKGEEISKTLLEHSPRGVTMLNGQGMYMHKERYVLLTCVRNRQIPQLKQLVNSVDHNAFIVINEAVEVRGKGFQALIDEGVKIKEKNS